MRASIKRIRLLANFNDNSTIRDWVVAGRDVGGFDISPVTYTKTGSGTTTTTETMSGSTKTTTVVTQFPTIVLPLSYNATTGNFTCNASTLKFTTITKKNPSAEWTEGPYVDEGPSSTFTTNSIATWADPEPIFAPSQSYGRLDPRLKSVSSLGNPASPWPASNNNATFAWGHYGNSTWGSSATLNLMQGYGYIGQLNVIHGEADKVGSNRLFTSNSSWTKNNLISGDPLPNSWRTEAIYDHFFHSEGAWFLDSGGDVKGVRKWPYFFKKSTSQVNGSDSGLVFTDASGNRVFMAPNDLGTVATNYPWRTLRMQIQPRNEISSTDGGGNMTSQSLIPDWAMLDVISFGVNSTTIPLNFSSHVNLNNKFVTPNGTLSSNRSQSLESLLRSLDSVSAADGLMFRNPFRLSGNYATASSNLGDYAFLPSGNTTCYDQLGNATLAAGLSTSNTTWSQLIARNIANMTWSPSSLWGSNNTATARVRRNKGFPANQLVLPSEVAEIRDIADLVSTNSTTLLSSTRYTNSPRHIKSNELRLSPFFPGATTCSNFFTIYAYAQALDKAGNVDSEHLTKTLVEVEITTPATATSAAVYKVKKLYTQSIPMGD
jgi:hypothetical protein